MSNEHAGTQGSPRSAPPAAAAGEAERLAILGAQLRDAGRVVSLLERMEERSRRLPVRDRARYELELWNVELLAQRVEYKVRQILERADGAS